MQTFANNIKLNLTILIGIFAKINEIHPRYYRGRKYFGLWLRGGK